jgi:hypothetical protein
MALGVAAAGTVLAAGQAVGGWAPGDAVMTHPVPLRDQGTWAPRLIAPAGLLARKPPSASWEAAAAFPVPALTADPSLANLLAVFVMVVAAIGVERIRTLGAGCPSAGSHAGGQVAQGRGGHIDAGRVDKHAEAPGRTVDLGREPVYQELLHVRTPTPPQPPALVHRLEKAH